MGAAPYRPHSWRHLPGLAGWGGRAGSQLSVWQSGLCRCRLLQMQGREKGLHHPPVSLSRASPPMLPSFSPQQQSALIATSHADLLLIIAAIWIHSNTGLSPQ